MSKSLNTARTTLELETVKLKEKAKTQAEYVKDVKT
jgi:hypothetical protein